MFGLLDTHPALGFVPTHVRAFPRSQWECPLVWTPLRPPCKKRVRLMFMHNHQMPADVACWHMPHPAGITDSVESQQHLCLFIKSVPVQASAGPVGGRQPIILIVRLGLHSLQVVCSHAPCATCLGWRQLVLAHLSPLHPTLLGKSNSYKMLLALQSFVNTKKAINR